MTDVEEIAGLLALMLLHHAQRPGADQAQRQPGPLRRVGPIPLNHPARRQGVDVLHTPLGRDLIGESRAQAAIAALHARPRAPRRPTACRSSAGTTNCSGSPGPRVGPQEWQTVAMKRADELRAA